MNDFNLGSMNFGPFDVLHGKSVTIEAYGMVSKCEFNTNMRYRNNRRAIQLTDTETLSPFAIVSVNLEAVELADDECCMKFWSENAPLRQPLIDSGLFHDTGKRVPTGYVEAEIWQIL